MFRLLCVFVLAGLLASMIVPLKTVAAPAFNFLSDTPPSRDNVASITQGSAPAEEFNSYFAEDLQSPGTPTQTFTPTSTQTSHAHFGRYTVSDNILTNITQFNSIVREYPYNYVTETPNIVTGNMLNGVPNNTVRKDPYIR